MPPGGAGNDLAGKRNRKVEGTMEEKPSDYDEQTHPPEPPPPEDPVTGENEQPNETNIEPGVPPAFDPATKPPASHP